MGQTSQVVGQLFNLLIIDFIIMSIGHFSLPFHKDRDFYVWTITGYTQGGLYTEETPKSTMRQTKGGEDCTQRET